MPYKVQGRKVLHKKRGEWRVKQVASSPEKAEATVRLLYGIESGWKPTKTTVSKHTRKGRSVRKHDRRLR